MKHSTAVTLVLIGLFLVSQFLGLWIVDLNKDAAASAEAGEPVLKDIKLWNTVIDRPEIEQSTSFIYIFIAVIIGTAIAFLLIRFRVFKLWKIWFFIAVWITATISLQAFMASIIATIVAVLLAAWKILKPNFVIHNLTELLVYAGIAVIFVPVMNMLAAFILLILISFYDAWAVWKSKTMIKLAKAQSKRKIFAGFLIPYSLPKRIPKGAKVVKKKVKTAVLGGGDIGFCLLFAATAWKTFGMAALIIPLFTTAALTYLLIMGKKDKFYPAMPYLTTGSFIGYLVLILIF